MGRILIQGGAVVTMEPRVADLSVGDVLVENDRVAGIAPNIPTPDGAQILDAADCIVVPGLINPHVHTWQSALRLPVTCRQALEWPTINGAKMLGLDDRIGALAPGKQADVILLRGGDLNLFPVHDPIASTVMQGGVANVDTVVIAGGIVKRGGKLLYADLEQKKSALRRSGERILGDFGLEPQRAA